MLDVYELLFNIINPICTCFVIRPLETDTKVYPYCELNFPNVTPNNTFSDNNLLEINVWDNKDTDIREIEAIVKAINTALNHLNYNNGTMQVNINKNTPWRLELPDPKIEIQRRQLRYIVTVYYKN